ncbi:MAG: class I SAM-dependent methyltransferase [Christensenellaceae bacterium]|nr:class I SAM-dependent methyltransferase [Christensenellaceae bacterium]MBR3563435.1 class I SAM-dependent methyltransferase [Clostridia bacterium]
MSRFEGVADTLYIPLTARIYVSEHFPEYFMDEKALSLKSEIPYEEIASNSSEYYHMAGACRFYNTDRMIKEFIGRHDRCNIVNIGCGLETSYFRIGPDPEKAVFYEMDLPEVIEARRKVLGESVNEILVPGDMFDFRWAEGIDKSLPTLVTAIGVFQYFEKYKVISFLKRLRKGFPDVEVIFDAMTGKAKRYANEYIRKTGNKDAELHFSADSGRIIAGKCGMELIEERPFFGTARKQLKKRLKLYTRIAMKVVDESGRRGFLTHLKG